jgi:ribosome-associated heat shock protein Hsp15
VNEEPCRIDVWLWRARFFKTRGLATKFVEAKRVRLSRPGQDEVRLEKPSRTVRPADRLVFVIGGKLFDLVIADCGERRGPAVEARALYVAEDVSPPGPT